MQWSRFAFTVSLAIALAIVSAGHLPLLAQTSRPTATTELALPSPTAGEPSSNSLIGGVRFSPPPIPPGEGPGGRPRGGASRDICPRSPIPLTALVPWMQRTSSGQAEPVYDVWGQTTADHPTVWFYIPYAQKPDYSAEFILQDDAENDIYRGAVPLPAAPGIVGVTVPSSAAALETGKTYHWYLYFYCDKKKTPPPVFVHGLIQRIHPDAQLASQLARATPMEQVKLYADRGIWFNAVTTLADLYRANPNDRTLKTNWQSLLQSIGVEAAIVTAPLAK